MTADRLDALVTDHAACRRAPRGHVLGHRRRSGRGKDHPRPRGRRPRRATTSTGCSSPCARSWTPAPRCPIRIGVNRGSVFVGEVGPPYRRTFTVMGDAVNLAARLMAKAETGPDPVHARAVGPLTDPLRDGRSRALLRQGKVPSGPGPSGGSARGGPGGRHLDGVAPRSAGRPKSNSWPSWPPRLRPGTARWSRSSARRGRASRGWSPRSARSPRTGCSSPQCANGTTRRPPTTRSGGCCAPSRPPLRGRRRGDVGPVPGRAGEPGAGAAPVGAAHRHGHRGHRPRDPGVTGPRRGVSPSPSGPRRHRAPGASSSPTPGCSSSKTPTTWTRPPPTSSVTWPRRSAPPPGCGARRDWISHSGFVAPEGSSTRIELGPLSEEAALELARVATEDAPLSERELSLLVERSGGNPLFLRELIAAARSGDAVESLPESIEEVAAARIDRLPVDARRLLRRMSVLGQSFTVDLLADVIDDLPGPDDPTWQPGGGVRLLGRHGDPVLPRQPPAGQRLRRPDVSAPPPAPLAGGRHHPPTIERRPRGATGTLVVPLSAFAALRRGLGFLASRQPTGPSPSTPTPKRPSSTNGRSPRPDDSPI